MAGLGMTRERRAVVVAVLAVLLLTGLAAVSLRGSERGAEQALVDRAGSTTAAAVRLELTRYTDIAQDLAVILGSVEELDQERYVALMDELRVQRRLPELVGISLVTRVERSALEDGEVQLGDDRIAVFDDAGEPILRVLSNAYPEATNASAIGLDTTSRPESRAAHDRVVAEGAAILSDAAYVVQIPDEPGALLHAPVPDDGGVSRTLAMVISAPRLLAAAEPPSAGITIELVDPTSTYTDLLAREGEPIAADDPVVATAPVEVAGQDWFARATATPGFALPFYERASTAVLLGGIIVALLVGWLARTLTSRERVASELASDRTTELTQVNERLASTNAALADANRSKDEFLASISHELRTPLTVIAGFVEVLRRSEGLDASALGYLDPIERNVRRLDTLVADLLTLVSIDAGAVTAFPDDLDLTEILRRAPQDLVMVEPGQVRLTVPDGLRVRVDRRHLERVLTNLLGNALRHGAVPIEIEAFVPGPDQVAIAIRDHGAGIEEAERLDVFERFSRGHDSVNVPGTGLGLAIVRELLSINGGTIRYEDADPGARFVIVLPASVTAPAGVEAGRRR
jgi:signal transduction histidine kinase